MLSPFINTLEEWIAAGHTKEEWLEAGRQLVKRIQSSQHFHDWKLCYEVKCKG